jgi:CheY-like chemotaxis protein/two-component sensor histidine kinase
VALYAELDEKADHLRRADDLKSRFLSNMTHEFRTPVNSILGLCGLLVDDRQREGRDPEPEVMYIRKAAEQLSELVNDLLDLAKVQAGKTVVRAAPFEVDNLFGALRGMLRPLLLNQSVTLVFEDPENLPVLNSDEGKVSQILRNLISNALKFTERGEVRVSANAGPDGTIVFSVSDTGIGIAPEDQQRIFEEFAQLEHRLQRGVRGTGLGLTLSRQLAGLLGGALSVRSEPGIGSTFTLTLPAQYETRADPSRPAFEWAPEPGKLPLLVVDDAADAQFFYEKVLKTSTFQIYPAHSTQEAEAALTVIRPAAIVLDIMMGGEEAWDYLVRIRRDDRLRGVPVIVVSTMPDRAKGLALGADAYLFKPIDRRMLLDTLTGLYDRQQPPLKVLTIDDEEVARYLIRQCLQLPAFELIEANEGGEGIRRARAERPDVILLDLVMPGIGGLDTLAELGAHEDTSAIPVVIVTATVLEQAERDALLEKAAAIMPKSDLSRDTLTAAVRRAARRRRGNSPI